MATMKTLDLSGRLGVSDPVMRQMRRSCFIVGPTASGKTGVAIELAKKIGGEIICADSRTVYRGLDIGTAKPTKEEQDEVKHWGLDVVWPNEMYTAHQFKLLAEHAMRDIWSRGKVPIITGGTGLYINSVLYDMQLGSPADQEYRAELNKKTELELQEIIKSQHLTMPENYKNKRHLVRAIELAGQKGGHKSEPINGAIVVGITIDRDVLRSRIHDRAKTMFDNPGLYKEAEVFAQKYGWDAPGLTGNIYRLLRAMGTGEMTQEQAIEKSEILDWQLARRQITWLKRDQNIIWMPREEIVDWVRANMLQ
jgi:tRNA dimethylallyltransferase